ncbi:L-rhamnose 1-dehydrogenase (NADP(+)) [uncultured archaeon]|nr:L-rhamnose 1-dehydrogenase (NADP(+)) [uncultured archaeon]
MRFKNKVVVVTGAGSGIGRAIALAFAKEGASVVIASHHSDGKKVEQEIVKAGGKALFVQADVSGSASVRSMVDGVIKKFKRVDFLVNNAGILLHGDAVSTSEADWNRVLDVNLKGMFLCAKYVVPCMKSGAIVNISSEWGLSGGRDVLAYCASKGGVVNLTRAMALDYARKGIRVNAVCPGLINTKMLTGFFSKKELREIGQMVPMRRIGEPEEIARVILFLCSDDASYVTGAVLSVDGGDMAGTY